MADDLINNDLGSGKEGFAPSSTRGKQTQNYHSLGDFPKHWVSLLIFLLQFVVKIEKKLGFDFVSFSYGYPQMEYINLCWMEGLTQHLQYFYMSVKSFDSDLMDLKKSVSSFF